MTHQRKKFGALGEQLATSFLKAKGFRILEVNYRTKFGEIDIIAQDEDTIVFVEVRTRYHEVFGHPLETVNHKKRRRLVKLAEMFLAEHFASQSIVPRSMPCRFDVVGIVAEGNSEPEIIHIENAFPSM